MVTGLSCCLGPHCSQGLCQCQWLLSPLKAVQIPGIWADTEGHIGAQASCCHQGHTDHSELCCHLEPCWFLGLSCRRTCLGPWLGPCQPEWPALPPVALESSRLRLLLRINIHRSDDHKRHFGCLGSLPQYGTMLESRNQAAAQPVLM